LPVRESRARLACARPLMRYSSDALAEHRGGGARNVLQRIRMPGWRRPPRSRVTQVMGSLAGEYDVVLVARREQRLQELASELRDAAGVDARVVVQDLAEHDAAATIASALRADRVTVRHVVNNAGLGDYGPFSTDDLESLRRLIAVNVVALTELTHHYLPDLLATGRGGVLNVSSTAGFVPGPLMAVYYASKAFVTSLTEALHEEVRGSGVTVTALCPGPTESEFCTVAGLEKSGLFRRYRVTTAAAVARQGYRDYMAGKALSLPGFVNAALPVAIGFAPRAVVRRVVHWLHED